MQKVGTLRDYFLLRQYPRLYEDVLIVMAGESDAARIRSLQGG